MNIKMLGMRVLFRSWRSFFVKVKHFHGRTYFGLTPHFWETGVFISVGNCGEGWKSRKQNCFSWEKKIMMHMKALWMSVLFQRWRTVESRLNIEKGELHSWRQLGVITILQSSFHSYKKLVKIEILEWRFVFLFLFGGTINFD